MAVGVKHALDEQASEYSIDLKLEEGLVVVVFCLSNNTTLCSAEFVWQRV